ncbi:MULTISPECIES: mechanosensitive ion channel family protein [unclassified Undibacterium]|uniref:mechanosensitive ion channel family protein n=1 Tax=unclassified Undibacterium TaxID=2630295 RepID=UPI002AC98E3D|nr:MULTISPECIES: mechanosensitive ion channel family protein [unclassified Undibacterium]MEB0140499.1 mechanosensitive ion channel family protein [Undibacterium sp. CCC2.1]MEB0173524.1 mechanosensitive ion channel family protein [Undibacterium sp. CCC1.1]MEB0175944.1 mechanosensitive ion channel family protein [Undibacterium sp. CCC3.4]MEB0216624.1 mechanosensitive ion channel family protein [Undibacterium sp. 5I2]WPX42342.1 mechanosensitive ion channel family protein [Undibacterium sp. CCC3.4
MPNINLEQLFNTYLIPFGIKILAALAIWIIGGMLINLLVNLLGRAMAARKVDPTLVNYGKSTLNVALRIALVMAILDVCGIQTTSFAALIAAGGVAIGVAWSGLLANFAAGIFLVILRPFKVGDAISAGGQTGEVTEIGLFATTINTGDNLRVYVGNNKIFADNIINYSANPLRRVDLKCQIANGVVPQQAIDTLKRHLATVNNIAVSPAPTVEILEFNPAGTLITLRPYCSNKDYWQVYFDTNKAIVAAYAEAGWPVPAVHQIAVQQSEK